jgi:hypothetical protein
MRAKIPDDKPHDEFSTAWTKIQQALQDNAVLTALTLQLWEAHFGPAGSLRITLSRGSRSTQTYITSRCSTVSIRRSAGSFSKPILARRRTKRSTRSTAHSSRGRTHSGSRPTAARKPTGRNR